MNRRAAAAVFYLFIFWWFQPKTDWNFSFSFCLCDFLSSLKRISGHIGCNSQQTGGAAPPQLCCYVQREEADSESHTGSVSGIPGRRLNVSTAWRVSTLSSDLEFPLHCRSLYIRSLCFCFKLSRFAAFIFFFFFFLIRYRKCIQFSTCC